MKKGYIDFKEISNCLSGKKDSDYRVSLLIYKFRTQAFISGIKLRYQEKRQYFNSMNSI